MTAPSPDPASTPATSGPDELVSVPRHLLEDLMARIERLERPSPADETSTPAPSPTPTSSRREAPASATAGAPAARAPRSNGRVGRRAALAGLAGAAAAGTAAALGPATPAAAANGDALVLGTSTNQATGATGLAVTGGTTLWGIGVTDNGLNTWAGSAAVLGHARNQAFTVALAGFAERGTGVSAFSGDGIAGRFNTIGNGGVAVDATGYIGVRAWGLMPLLITPRAVPLPDAATSGAVVATAASVTDTRSTLWYRHTENTTDPSGWRNSSAPTRRARSTSSPCRSASTTPGPAPHRHRARRRSSTPRQEPCR